MESTTVKRIWKTAVNAASVLFGTFRLRKGVWELSEPLKSDPKGLMNDEIDDLVNTRTRKQPIINPPRHGHQSRALSPPPPPLPPPPPPPQPPRPASPMEVEFIRTPSPPPVEQMETSEQRVGVEQWRPRLRPRAPSVSSSVPSSIPLPPSRPFTTRRLPRTKRPPEPKLSLQPLTLNSDSDLSPPRRPKPKIPVDSDGDFLPPRPPRRPHLAPVVRSLESLMKPSVDFSKFPPASQEQLSDYIDEIERSVDQALPHSHDKHPSSSDVRSGEIILAATENVVSNIVDQQTDPTELVLPDVQEVLDTLIQTVSDINDGQNVDVPAVVHNLLSSSDGAGEPMSKTVEQETGELLAEMVEQTVEKEKEIIGPLLQTLPSLENPEKIEQYDTTLNEKRSTPRSTPYERPANRRPRRRIELRPAPAREPPPPSPTPEPTPEPTVPPSPTPEPTTATSPPVPRRVPLTTLSTTASAPRRVPLTTLSTTKRWRPKPVVQKNGPVLQQYGESIANPNETDDFDFKLLLPTLKWMSKKELRDTIKDKTQSPGFRELAHAFLQTNPDREERLLTRGLVPETPSGRYPNLSKAILRYQERLNKTPGRAPVNFVASNKTNVEPEFEIDPNEPGNDDDDDDSDVFVVKSRHRPTKRILNSDDGSGGGGGGHRNQTAGNITIKINNVPKSGSGTIPKNSARAPFEKLRLNARGDISVPPPPPPPPAIERGTDDDDADDDTDDELPPPDIPEVE